MDGVLDVLEGLGALTFIGMGWVLTMVVSADWGPRARKGARRPNAPVR